MLGRIRPERDALESVTDPLGRSLRYPPAALYNLLARAEPSPVVELNRAVAVAMRDGPETGLALIDAILAPAIWLIPTWLIRHGQNFAGDSEE